MYTVLVILTLMNGCSDKKALTENELNSNSISTNEIKMKNDKQNIGIIKNSYTIEYVETVKIDEAKVAQLPVHAQQMIKDRLSKPRYSVLETNGNESIYKTLATEDDKNNNQVENTNGNKRIVKNTTISFVSDVFYKNLETSTIYKTTEIKGEKLTVMQKSDLQNLWKITNETKSVGGYTAQKATLDDPKLGQVGPEIFNGLPGLIVEVETDKKYITLKSINKAEKEIQLPSFSNVLTTQEYSKKMEELKQSSISSKIENSSGVKTNRIVIKSE
jgi:GLPGLI family protein